MTEAEKRAARATRFANDEKTGPPPMPIRKHAWPGGKLVSNKEEAVRKFLKRQAKQAATQSSSSSVSKPVHDEDETEVYVGNLPYKTESEALVSLFDGCSSARIVMERGKSRGYGFVSFRSAPLALAALSLNGTELLGRKLTVRPAYRRREANEAVTAATDFPIQAQCK